MKTLDPKELKELLDFAYHRTEAMLGGRYDGTPWTAEHLRQMALEIQGTIETVYGLGWD